MSVLNANNPEYTTDKHLRILQVLDKRTDVILNSVLLRSGLDERDTMIKRNFPVTMDLHSARPGSHRYYDDEIRKLVYGDAGASLSIAEKPLDAVRTEVVVAGSTWTITIGSARYTADASGLRSRPRDHWTLSLLRRDEYYTSNPLRAFVMWVNGGNELAFSLVE